MRKIVSVLTAVVLLISMTSIAFAADEFTLRNGILFGDTMDDILTKETTLTRKSDTSNWFEGKIAGYSNSECGFYFDDSEKLVSMDYEFSCSSRDNTNEVYKKLYQSLVRQYGKAEGNTGGSCELITGPALTNMAIAVYLLAESDGWGGDYIDYDEWIIDTDNYHVKIDLVSYYYHNSDYDYTYMVELSYHKYTDDDLQTVIEEKQTEQNEVDDDL